jgi:hypothetical protein
VVFGCAGLDASLKQLIRDALPVLLEINTQAREKFLSFVQRAINLEVPAAKRTLAEVLTASDPRGTLVDRYIYEMTGSSLQSKQQVTEAAGALGISDPAIRREVGALDPVFVARNQIVHELDLLDPERHGNRERRDREVNETIKLAHSALVVGQMVINGVIDLLRDPGTSGSPSP